MIDKGRTWVKVSGAYSNSKIGPPSYPEATKIAQAFVKAAPERLVWGSDWPHPGLPDNNKPNDALLFDLLTEWAPDEATRNRILVQNPEALYTSASRRDERRRSNCRVALASAMALTCRVEEPSTASRADKQPAGHSDHLIGPGQVDPFLVQARHAYV